MLDVSRWAWLLFFGVILAMLAVDLLSSSSRRASDVRAAARWSALWVVLSLAFGLWIYIEYGPGAGGQYFNAYLLEKSLSVDNVFVFVLVFSQLGIPARYQHNILLLGILGALVMRALMIAGGVYLLGQFHWVVYLFAGLLLVSAARLLFGEKQERALVRGSCDACGTWVARLVRVTPNMSGGRFFRREGGRFVATPLFVALIIVETSDLVFALDSIPAVLAVTREPFIAYSSNVFAMLGLRSLYFVLSGAVERFQYLRPGLALILVFVAAKMLLAPLVDIGAGATLLVIAGIVAGAVLVSFRQSASGTKSGRRLLPDEEGRMIAP